MIPVLDVSRHKCWKHRHLSVPSAKDTEMKTLSIIATGGFIFSLIAHLTTFLGINPQAVFPPIWLLHIGIFVVWIPTVFLLRKTFKKTGRGRFWKTAFSNAPRWMQALCLFFFIYAFFNFFITVFVLAQGGVPSIVNGKKVLQSHGEVIKELTDKDFLRYQAYTFRAFSGHWMFFYIVSMTILYSHQRARGKDHVLINPGPDDHTPREAAFYLKDDKEG